MTKDSLDTGRRLAALDDIGLRTSTPWSELDAIAGSAASLLGVPIALISVLDDARQVLKGAHGLPAPLAASRVTGVSPMCRQVVWTGRPVVVQDARNRVAQSGDDAIVALRIGGYAGVPLTMPDGTCFAVLSAISPQPRTWNSRDVDVLRALGATAMAIVERQQLERRCERLEQALRRERAARELLLRVATAASVATTSQQPLLDALTELTDHLGWPVGEVVGVDGERLASRAWRVTDGRYDALDDEVGRRGGDDRLIAAVIRTGAPASRELPTGSTAEQLGLATACAIPILVRGGVAAVIVLSTTDPAPALDEIFSLVARVATVLAPVIERERATGLTGSHIAALEDHALHDDLTGLLNRRGFFVVAESHLAIARRKLLPGLLIFVDLDGLKTANDRHGHGAGDELLRDAAAALRTTFRDADTIARLGGDEFVVLSMEAVSPDMPAIDERLAAEVLRVNRRRDPRLPLAWSTGVVSFEPGSAQTLGALMLEADRRMYEAKRRLRP
jgi:diguanylate cyclase (GGDEF)-like protein